MQHPFVLLLRMHAARFSCVLFVSVLLHVSNATFYGRKGKTANSVSPSMNTAFPRTGDLLIGRASSLVASSTCGEGGQRTQYCEPDPLNPSNPQPNFCNFCEVQEGEGAQDSSLLQPIIENVADNYNNIKSGVPKDLSRWYQSRPGEHYVTITINLNNPFIVTHVYLIFKSWIPKTMYIERSNDNGRTWKMHRYFSAVCPTNMTVRPAPSHPIDTVYCENRQSKREFEKRVVEYRVLPPTTRPYDPFSQEVEKLLLITNLRIVFAELHTYGDEVFDPSQIVKYFYALYAIRVSGTCFCNGHATSCKPGPYDDKTVLVYSWCNCRNSTDGEHCQRCADLNNDSPWASGRLAHDGRDYAAPNSAPICKPCNCNNHAAICRFNGTLYAQSGNRSGGVCECMHNTIGRNCERCAPGYFYNGQVDFTDPSACQNCLCNMQGSILDESGVPVCNQTGPLAGTCNCKQNVEGRRCELCKTGYYDMKQSNPLGCTECLCFLRGTQDGCDKTGQCKCKQNVEGDLCNQCKQGFFNVSSDSEDGCQACDCHAGGSYGPNCDPETGRCECKENMEGRRCDQPKRGYYLRQLDYINFEAENMISSGGKKVIDSWNWTHAKNWSGSGVLIVNPTGGEFTLNASFDGKVMLPEQSGRNTDLKYHPIIRFVLPSNYEAPPATLQVRLMLKTKARRTNCPPDQDVVLSLSTAYEKIELSPQLSYFVYTPIDTSFCLDYVQYSYESVISLADDQDVEENFWIGIDSIGLTPSLETLTAALGSGESDLAASVDISNFYSDCRSLLAWPLTQYAAPATIESSPAKLFNQVPKSCRDLVQVLSASFYGRAYQCSCNIFGSVSADCFAYGGQCLCRPNIIGPSCDQCMPRAFGFGADGCTMCECHVNGSTSDTCNLDNGQCACRRGALGRSCNRCADGLYGFPSCRPCKCNGRARTCDDTGQCIDCAENTTGKNCEQCKVGYFPYGPRTQRTCRECRCPGGNSSGIQHGYTCSAIDDYDYRCACGEGYAGKTCSVCAKNYFGNPAVKGGSCKACNCNGNINLADEGNCDPLTGKCFKCTMNTFGDQCEKCKPGYFGNAANVSKCSRCDCDLSGTATIDGNTCDNVTGDCICKRNVESRRCDRCLPGYYNISGADGCVPCSCNQQGSLSENCNSLSGECQCKDGYAGPKCNRCPDQMFGTPGRCRPCQCLEEGSLNGQCDDRGVCACKPGRTGEKCNKCAGNTINRLGKCTWCGQCYDNWNVIVTKFGENVSRILGERPGEDDENYELPIGPLFDEHMKNLDRNITKMEDTCARVNRTIGAIVETTNRINQDFNDVESRISQLANDANQADKEFKDNEASMRSRKIEIQAASRKLAMMDSRLRSIGQKTDVGTQQLIQDSNRTGLTAFMEIQQLLGLLNNISTQLSTTVRVQLGTRERVRSLAAQTGTMDNELTAIEKSIRVMNRMFCGVGTYDECVQCRTLFCESTDQTCFDCDVSLDSRTTTIIKEEKDLQTEIERMMKGLRALNKTIESWQNDRRLAAFMTGTSTWLYTFQQLERRSSELNSSLTEQLLRFKTVNDYLSLDAELTAKLLAIRDRILASNKTYSWSDIQLIQAQLIPLYTSIGNVSAVLTSPTVTRKITEVRGIIAAIRPQFESLATDLNSMAKLLSSCQQMLQNVKPLELDGQYDRLMKIMRRLNGTVTSLQGLNDYLPTLIASNNQTILWTKQTLIEIKKALLSDANTAPNCAKIRTLNTRITSAERDLASSSDSALPSDAEKARRVRELLDSIRQRYAMFDEKLAEIGNKKNTINQTVLRMKQLESDLADIEKRADRAVSDYNSCIGSIRMAAALS